MVFLPNSAFSMF